MDPSIFPEEIWIKIFSYCDVKDILACGCTCKYLGKIVSSDYLWKQKWMQLSSMSKFAFPKAPDVRLLHKEVCMRLNNVFNDDTVFPRCYHCLEFTCHPFCSEERGSKVVVDIGNKFTWIITPSFGVRRHFTMFGIPKISEEDVLQEKSIPKSEKKQNERRPSEPFCVFCNPVRLYREKKRVARQNGISCAPSQYVELLNGFCKDTVEILGIPNMDVVSPAAALLEERGFPVVRDFVGHLFHQMGLVPVLQKPNAALVFCEPLQICNKIRMLLIDFLFTKIKVARVCLVAKPLATCAMVGMDTCVVVDSGALNTSVTVIVGGQVVIERCRHIPVGGWHVAENLKHAMQWQPEEYTEIPISYLDNLAVKEKCRLSYNFANEERRRGPARREHINLRVDSYADYKQFWRVSLGSELYLAPEMMYVSLALPKVIQEVTEGLPIPVLKECLGHILLTGGNTDLAGFKTRVARDLRELLPQYSSILDVKTCPGSSSWSVAMGSTYLSSRRLQKPRRRPGLPFWLTREEYVLFGCDVLNEV